MRWFCFFPPSFLESFHLPLLSPFVVSGRRWVCGNSTFWHLPAPSHPDGTLRQEPLSKRRLGRDNERSAAGKTRRGLCVWRDAGPRELRGGGAGHRQGDGDRVRNQDHREGAGRALQQGEVRCDRARHPLSLQPPEHRQAVLHVPLRDLSPFVSAAPLHSTTQHCCHCSEQR